MKTYKTAISLPAGTSITVYDMSRSCRNGEKVVEAHYYYDALGAYDIMLYPEGFAGAKDALNGEMEHYIVKAVYHMNPESDAAQYPPTADI